MIGPGGGRDLVSALVFGAGHVDGVEINPIIANDVMRGQFREYSGGIYTNPKVHIVIDDGRSGFLVDLPTPVKLAERIQSAIANPDLRHNIARTARQLWESRYSLAHYRDAVTQVMAYAYRG